MAKYITNKELAEQLAICKTKGRLNNKVALYIMQLSERLSRKGNFAGYTFRDELVSCAIVKLTENILKYDPEKGDNPFAYATAIAWNAMVAEIKARARQTEIKNALIAEAGDISDKPNNGRAAIVTAITPASYDPFEALEGTLWIGKPPVSPYRPIPSLDGYEASQEGIIRSVGRWKEHTNRDEYIEPVELPRCGVNMSKVRINGTRYPWPKLVAMAFGADIKEECERDPSLYRSISERFSVDRQGRVWDNDNQRHVPPSGISKTVRLDRSSVSTHKILEAIWPEDYDDDD